MPASQKPDRPVFSGFRCLLLALLLCGNTLAAATEVKISSVAAAVENKILVINASIIYSLGKDVVEALENGIALTFYVEIDINRPRAFLWDEELVHLTKYLKLSYHSLSDHYLVSDTITGDQQSFNSLSDALDYLGNISALPIIEARFIDSEQPAVGHIKSGIDIEELPTVMRLQAWLSSQWRTDSGWVMWEIYP